MFLLLTDYDVRELPRKQFKWLDKLYLILPKEGEYDQWQYYVDMDFTDTVEIKRMMDFCEIAYKGELHELEENSAELWYYQNELFADELADHSELFEYFLSLFGVSLEPTIDYKTVNQMSSQLVPDEYLSLGRFYSTLDGRFSSAELRRIAHVMDSLPEVVGCEGHPANQTERR